MQLLLATTNDSKIREIKQILNAGIDFKTYRDFSDWPEVEETGKSFKENAFMKSSVFADKYNVAAVADDSGLVVEILNGEPGVYSSRYAGVDASDEQNIRKLLSKLEGVENRSAAFVATIVYYDTSSKIIVAEGKIEGHIIEEPRGSGGFGYDPVFVPKGYEATFAQMSAAEKNKLSHRGRAFRKLKETFLEEGLIK